MPQIGWLEILSVVIIAILVLGPKEFPIALKKIGTYVGKFKNTIINFQREVSSVTKEVDLEEEFVTKNGFDRHKAIHAVNREKYTCEACNKDFLSIPILRKHKQNPYENWA